MKPPNRYFWCMACIIVPVIFLAVVAAIGLGSQRKAVLADAQSQAREVAQQVAERLKTALAERVAETPATVGIPLPVPPATPSAAAGQLAVASAQQDRAALEKLAGGVDGQLSDAGLPVATVAALAAMDFGPPLAASASVLYHVQHPSLLTQHWLEKLETLVPAPQARAQWDHDETVRKAFWDTAKQNWSEMAHGPAVVHGKLFWVADGNVVLTSHDLDQVLAETWANRYVPSWMGLGIAETNPMGEVLATVQGPFMVLATLQHPEILFAPTDRIAWWIAWLVGISMVSSVLGLWVIKLNLARERRLNELKSQFVSSVSHELRAPVGSLRLMADALASGTVTGEPASRFHKLMSQEGARLSSLIDNVLDFARIEENRKTYTLEETDIATLIHETIQLMVPLAAARGITLVEELETLSQVPKTDAQAIQQALVNLLDNAIKFSPPDQTVTISLAESQPLQHWRLTVEDHGVGIPATEHQRIFDRFHRLGNELRRETQGAGIGLSLVKHIAEGHGGKVLVKSELGHGSTFILQLPISGK
jgi:signal transduction histidine kinase